MSCRPVDRSDVLDTRSTRWDRRQKNNKHGQQPGRTTARNRDEHTSGSARPKAIAPLMRKQVVQTQDAECAEVTHTEPNTVTTTCRCALTLFSISAAPNTPAAALPNAL
jgi:hypothetical protein